MKRWISALLAVLMLALAVFGFVKEFGTNQNTAKKSVVRTYGEDDVNIMFAGKNMSDTVVGWGSAIFLGKDKKGISYFVTNRHVVSSDEAELNALYSSLTGYEEGSVRTGSDLNERMYIVLSDIENKVAAEVVAVSERTDLAIISVAAPILGRELVPASFRSFDSLSSEQVYTLGYPAIADDFKESSGVSLPSTIDDITVSSGTVSSVLRPEQGRRGELIQMDASIHHGNSGGALVDRKGRVLGVNTFGRTRAGDTDSLYYAVSSNEVIRFCAEEKIAILNYTVPVWLIVAIVALILCVVFVILAICKFGGKRPDPAPKDGNELRIQGISGVYAGKRFAIPAQMRIGRGSDNELSYPDQTQGVSARHCTLVYTGGRLILQNHRPTYHTFVNGMQVADQQSMELHVGDRFALGSENQSFMVVRKGGN